ncbi:MAG: hypothetical protein LBS23_00340, partial [Holosporaceae bacterium]|nr:hypothetical protein [Holosporaceae bacterium]
MKKVIILFLFFVFCATKCECKKKCKRKNIYDMVYVISLDRTPGRFENVKRQLDAARISHKRFSAVDGYELKLINLTSKEIVSGKNSM